MPVNEVMNASWKQKHIMSHRVNALLLGTMRPWFQIEVIVPILMVYWLAVLRVTVLTAVLVLLPCLFLDGSTEHH